MTACPSPAPAHWRDSVDAVSISAQVTDAMTEPRSEPRRILLCEDDARYAERLRRNLKLAGYTVDAAANGQEALAGLAGQDFDLVLCDVKMPKMGGLELLERIRSGEEAGVDSDIAFVFLTSLDSVETGVAAVKAGADDYIVKGADLDTLLLRLDSVLSRHGIEAENRLLRGQLESVSEFGELVAESEAMRFILREIDEVASSRLPVLITGETGVGKELVARAIHDRSDRRDRAFLPVNCAALPEDNLFHSELFGHEKGAFTGADERRRGKFELAHGGTVFLDEVGDLTRDSQGKLLRFLDDFCFERLGGAKRIQVDVRIVSATNRELERRVEEGVFRRDLYFRLNGVALRIPPLSRRTEDIPALTRHFAARFARRAGHAPPQFSEAALDALARSPWPGNVRELRNIIERLVIRHRDGVIDEPALRTCGLADRVLSGGAIVNLPPGGAALDAIEMEAVRQALALAGGVQKEAAALLRISEDRMNARVKKYKIAPS